jgi:HSP20 family molecular chaperone IbpA
VATDGKHVTIRGPIGAPFAAGHVWMRSFVLPIDVDSGKARASCALGTLRIELPKCRAEPKQISGIDSGQQRCRLEWSERSSFRAGCERRS